jgi:DNA-binding beta-propeller fold protein YncE
LATASQLLRIDPIAGSQSPELALPFSATDIAAGSDGYYYLAEGQFVSRVVPPEAGEPSAAITVVAGPSPLLSTSVARSVAIDSAGNVLVSAEDGNVVIRIDPATGDHTIVRSQLPSNSYPGHLEAEPSGDALLPFQDEILRVTAADGRVSTIAQGGNLAFTRSIVREASGDLLFLATPSILGNGLFRLRSNGIQSAESTGQLLDSSDFQDVAVVGSKAFVTDAQGNRVIVMDLNGDPNSNQTTVVGGSLETPRGIASEAGGTLAIAVSNGTCRVARLIPPDGLLCISSEMDGDELGSPLGIAVHAVPEPGAAVLQWAVLAALALMVRRRDRASV